MTKNLLSVAFFSVKVKEIKDMKKLVPTDKAITRKAIHEEVMKQPYCEELMMTYQNFELWASKKNDTYLWNYGLSLQGALWQEWLVIHPEAQQCLVDHGFAKWEEDFEPVYLKIESMDELLVLWHRMNHAERDFSRNYGYEKQRSQPNPSGDMCALSHKLWRRANSLLVNQKEKEKCTG